MGGCQLSGKPNIIRIFVENVIYMDFVVLPSQLHGFGCFANRFILKGELFTFNVILINPENISDLTYTFPWSGNKLISIVLGEITYANSSNTPNMIIKSVDKNQLTKTFMALNDININDEITLKYKY